jgi:hypothetical protein
MTLVFIMDFQLLRLGGVSSRDFFLSSLRVTLPRYTMDLEPRKRLDVNLELIMISE